MQRCCPVEQAIAFLGPLRLQEGGHVQRTEHERSRPGAVSWLATIKPCLQTLVNDNRQSYLGAMHVQRAERLCGSLTIPVVRMKYGGLEGDYAANVQ